MDALTNENTQIERPNELLSSLRWFACKNGHQSGTQIASWLMGFSGLHTTHKHGIHIIEGCLLEKSLNV